MKWNVIWQVNPYDLSSCIEREWFYELISLVRVGDVHTDYDSKPLLKRVLPYPIICASTLVQTAKAALVDYLKLLPKPRVLYHMSDETVTALDVYQYCDLAIQKRIRMFRTIRCSWILSSATLVRQRLA